MTSIVRINQVLLLFDEHFSEEVGLALWTALIEVENFYNHEKKRGEFTRDFISPFVPSPPFPTDFRGVARSFGGDDIMHATLNFFERQRAPAAEPWDERASGRYRNAYDQKELAKDVLGLIDVHDARLAIVTDREIIPPLGFRYIIWDTVPEGGVVSAAPLDPNYWRDPDPSRIWTIKRRMRNALLCLTGEELGFTRCENPSCYLNKAVDSVMAIDFMTEFGEEHSAPDLEGNAFEAGQDSTAVQRIVPRSGLMT
ncbi:MAG: hypothetical protein M3N49_11355 [Candidatus Eremiobacteraeota bacterium]|nr:hypothetical protein [Candidatus Eremiobacteraeota bacterium]